jgi:hypothetical protein
MEVVGEKLNKIMEKLTRENLVQHLVDYELNMVGKTRLNAIDDDRWYFNFTMTRKQHNEFKVYAIKLIRKIYKCNRLRGEKWFDQFDMAYGLRIKGL